VSVLVLVPVDDVVAVCVNDFDEVAVADIVDV